MDVVKGKALFFAIESAGVLSVALVENRRISATKRHGDLPQFVKSGPLFLESRNFFPFQNSLREL